MSGPFETQMTIGVKDNASAGIQRIRSETQRMQEARERLGVRSEHAIRRAIQQTEASYNRLASSGKLSAAELSRAHEMAATKISRLQKEMAEVEVRSYTRRNTAREAYTALGIRSEQSIQREIQKTVAAYNRLERSGTLSATALTRAHEKMTSTVSKLEQELGKVEEQSLMRRNTAREAWERLGVRSEHSIRREIQQTEAAYNRLERSGVLSAQELQRAQEKTIATVGKLRRELGEVAKQERTLGERFRGGAAVAGKIGGAVLGAGMLLRGPINDAAAYDATLRREANFAYSDRDTKGRLEGMDRMSSAVQDAVDKTGASPEEAFAALETMWRSGVIGKEKPYKFLNNVLRNAAATGADAESVASTQASAVNFGMNDDDAAAALSVLTTFAQHGKVDVPELARAMPRALEAGKSAGYHGTKGFSQIGALFEAAAIGTGDPQEAATNTNDLLAALSGNNLQNSAERIRINGHKLDIRGMMRNDLAHGKTALDTVTGVISKMDSTDPQFKRLTKQLSSATTDEQRANIQAQIDQIHGQHISQLFPNQQDRNAYLNFDRNRPFYDQLVKEGGDQFSKPEGQRSADQDWKLVSDSAQWKMDREKNMAVVTSNKSAGGAAALWGDVMNHVADLEKEFPALATAVSGTTSAFQTLRDSGLGGVLGGALGMAGIKKIFGRKPPSVAGAGEAGGEVAGAAEGAEVAGGEAAGGGILSTIGRWILGGGRALGGAAVNGGKSLVTDGLMSNPLLLGIAGLIYTPDTVSGSSESAELARLKNQNYGKNSRQTSAEALNYLQNYPGHDVPAGGGPIIKLPAQPAPNVTVNMFLDGQKVSDWLYTEIERNARRHGA